jgi:HAD superfamily hydrolase (TIGR01509 family)
MTAAAGAVIAAHPGVRAALFDVDGTLLDSNDMHIEAWGRAFRDFGLEASTERLRGQMGNGGERLVEALCRPEDAARLSKALLQRHGEIFQRAFLPHVRPFPGVRALFERLHADGVRIVLASSVKRDERERHIDILGVRDLLDAASGELAEDSKPAPDVFQAGLARLGNVAPRDTIAVGDSIYDALAARRAGMRAIGVLTGSFSERRLREAGASLVFRDIADMLENYDRLIPYPVRNFAVRK